VPATPVPMAAQIGLVIWNDHDVIGPHRDGEITPRTEIILTRGVSLNGTDGYPENMAHATRAIAAPIASTTMTMSTGDRLCSRNGLKPMFER